MKDLYFFQKATTESALLHAVQSEPDLLCTSGSRLYGTNREDSDLDLRGFVLPPYEYLIGLRRFDEMDGGGEDHRVFSLRRWMDLTLRGDPQCTEMLFTPGGQILTSSSIGAMILEHRDWFLSRKIFWRVAGYSNSEWRKAQGVKVVPEKRTLDERQVIDDIRNLYKPDKAAMDQVIALLEENRAKKIVPSKQNLGAKRKAEFEKFGFGVSSAAHSIRLMEEVTELLLTGEMTFPRPDAKFLKKIRLGDYTLDQIEPHFDYVKHKAEEAFEESALPDKPNVVEVDKMYAKIVCEFLRNDPRFQNS